MSAAKNPCSVCGHEADIAHPEGGYWDICSSCSAQMEERSRERAEWRHYHSSVNGEGKSNG